MSNIQPYNGSSEVLPSDARRAGRTISRYQASGRVEVAKLDTAADIAAAKGEIITAVTGQAMANVVRVAQAQKQLEMLAPEASGRLNMLADDHMLSMADVMADLRRDMRRR